MYPELEDQIKSKLLEFQNEINSLEIKIKPLIFEYFKQSRGELLKVKTVDLIPNSDMLLLNRLTRFETSIKFENIEDDEIKELLNVLKKFTKEWFLLKY